MLNVRALTLSVALLWGGSMMIIAWIATLGWLTEYVTFLSHGYIGYRPGFLGGLIGGAWGAIDGAIGALALGLLYNYFSSK